MSDITPVTLLTGYLGSGKTTLLNQLLLSPALKDTAVLINEYGETAIDHLLVRQVSGNIQVLANGCVCCSVAGELVSALRDLHFKRANKEVPYFSRVIIETTGLADPAPIMHTLIEMPLVAARYQLSGVVSTVDATHGAAQLDVHREAVKQAAVADRIVLTKVDLATADDIAHLTDRLKRLNPGAQLIESIMGNADAESLLNTGLYQPKQKTVEAKNWLKAEAYRQLRPAKILPQLSAMSTTRMTANRPRHDERINAFCVRYDAPIVWDSLINALEMMQSIRASQLLRIKGIVNVAGEARPRVLHVVEHTIYPVTNLAAWPDADNATRLVFIVHDLDEAFIL
ncbi:MAG: GTP-binding protein, partial [Gammaproteobacteria bacterium]|nr:GTP-binding protein [Gammaproteobacteria bacterium]